MGGVFLFAFLAALNPTLLAATTVMLLLDNPKRLLIGYLLGALMTSITLGLVIVFSLEGSSFVDTAQNTLSPAANFALGGIALVIAYVLATGRDKAMSERRHERKAEKERQGAERSAEVAAVPRPRIRGLGVRRRCPADASGRRLSDLAQQARRPGPEHGRNGGNRAPINLIMLALLELPTLSYQLAPDTTAGKVDRIKAAISRHGRQAGIWGAAVIGGLLIVRGVIELAS